MGRIYVMIYVTEGVTLCIFKISSNATDSILVVLAGPCQNDLKLACQISE